jgi:hypothetical protein
MTEDEGSPTLESLGVVLVLEFENGAREEVPLKGLLCAPLTLKAIWPYIVDFKSPISVVAGLLNREVAEEEVDP